MADGIRFLHLRNDHCRITASSAEDNLVSDSAEIP